MEIPFVGGSYKARSNNANAQRCVNLFPATDKQLAKHSLILVGTPGTIELSDIPSAIIPPPIVPPAPVLMSNISYNDSSDRVGYSEGNAFDGRTPQSALQEDGAVQMWYGGNYRQDGWVGQAFGIGNEKIIRSFRLNMIHADKSPSKITFKASTTGAYAGEEVILLEDDHAYWPILAGWVPWNVDNDTAYPYYRVYIEERYNTVSTSVIVVNECDMYDQHLTSTSTPALEYGETNWAWRNEANTENDSFDFAASPPGRYACGVIASDSVSYGWASYSNALGGYQTFGWFAQRLPWNDMKIITNYGFYIADVATAPKTWTFEGSQTGLWTGDEVVLDTQTNYVFPVSYGWVNFNFTNIQAYKYLRVNVSENNGDPTYLRIREIDLQGTRLDPADLVYEDLTAYTVVDPSSKFTITTNQLTCPSVDNEDDIYMYRQLSSPVGDFQLRAKITFNYTDEYSRYWLIYLSNTNGSASDAISAGSGIGIELYRGNYSSGLYAQDFSTSARDDAYYRYYDYDYWFEMTRIGTQCTIKLFDTIDCTRPVYYGTIACLNTQYSVIGSSSRNETGTQTCNFEMTDLMFDPWIF